MIRLMSIVPLLAAEGFVGSPLTSGHWTEFSSLTAAQRDTLRDRHGLWLRVHPHDHSELVQIGLDFARDADGRPRYQAPLVELAAKAPAPAAANGDDGTTNTANTTTNTKAPATDNGDGKPKRKDR